MLKTYKEYNAGLKAPLISEKVKIEQKEKQEKKEEVRYQLHCPEWEVGNPRNYEITIDNEIVKVVNNVCYTYSKQIRDDLIRQGYLLLKELKI